MGHIRNHNFYIIFVFFFFERRFKPHAISYILLYYDSIIKINEYPD